jgi:hypothetical protein
LRIDRPSTITKLLDPHFLAERYFALKGAEYFVTNNARNSLLKSKLESHWRDVHPFQPEWVAWHPAYSLDAYMQGPPRYRQQVRMIDAAFVRLYLDWAREENTYQRVARRIFEEEVHERKFFARKDLESWMERQDFRKKVFWQNIDRLERFLRERIEKAKAIIAYRHWLEKMTDHEKYLSDLFADMISKRKFETIELGYEKMFTTTENGVVVMLPRYGRAVQVIWGDIHHHNINQREAKNFHWHASHRYMTTENGVIVPLPVMGKAIHWMRAEISHDEFKRLHKLDLDRLEERRSRDKKFYSLKSERVSLEKSRFVIEKINDYALGHKELLAKIAKPGFEGKLADLKKAKERAEAKLLRQEARALRLERQIEDSPDDVRSQRILSEQPLWAAESLDEKLESTDPVVHRDIASHHPRGSSGMDSVSSLDRQGDRYSLEELQRKLAKPARENPDLGDGKKVKDLQRNLASQAAASESLLAQHVNQPPQSTPLQKISGKKV